MLCFSIDLHLVGRTSTERRLAYGKALRYQSRENGEQITELELIVGNPDEKGDSPEMKEGGPKSLD